MRLTRARFKFLIDQALSEGSKVYVLLGYQRLRIRAVTLLRRTGVRLHHAASASSGASTTVLRSLMPVVSRRYLGWDEDANPTMIVIGPARIRRMATYGPECVTFCVFQLIPSTSSFSSSTSNSHLIPASRSDSS